MRREFFTWERSALCGRGSENAGPGPVSVRVIIKALLLILVLFALLLTLTTGPAPAAPSGNGSPAFAWPCRGPVCGPFRSPTGSYGQGGHAGIDISVPHGTAVAAAAAGTVYFSGPTPVGLCVTLSHADGIKTTYVSLTESGVRAGMRVERGTRLGSSDGSKDRSTSQPHLHFGASLNGMPVDPLLLLSGRLLDPSRDLFLGPWEDQRSLDALTREIGFDQGFLETIGDGLASVGRAVGGVLGQVWDGIVAAAKWVGRGCAGFYRACIEPWAGGTIEKIGRAVKAVFANRYVQAVLAAVVAIAIITVVVLSIALTFGLSLVLAGVAIAAGALACLGYATYYACVSGDGFSFAQCLSGCLMVGGTVALTVLCLGQSWSLLSAGGSKLGLLGFGKSFLVHGMADSLSYAAINGIAGKPFSWKAFAVTFVLGGLCGATGKLFVTGLSERMLEGLAASSFAAGQVGSESFYIMRTSLTLLKDGGFGALVRLGTMEFGKALAEKLTYMTFSGCMGLLTNFSIHLLCGSGFSLGEGLLSFGAGFCVGGINLTVSTISPARILANAACVYQPMATEFARNYLNKTAVRGGRELLNARYGSGEGGGWEILPGRE